MDRRNLLAALGALAVTGADGQIAETPTKRADGVLGMSRVFPFADLAVKKNANGSETRPALQGVLVTGEAVEVHETTLMPGGVPNPPHAHRQSDIILVREGTIAFEHDGKAEQVGAGGVVFVSSETMHTLRNVGEGRASYFVVILGRDTNAMPGQGIQRGL